MSSQPSASNRSAPTPVRYPVITPGPRTCTRPDSPAGSARPPSPSTRSSPSTGRPTDPGRRSSSGFTVIWLAASVIPYDSSTGMPCTCSNRSSTGTGSGAEALRTNRTRAGSLVVVGCSASSAMIAGTALTQVARCRSTVAQKVRRENRRSSTSVPCARRVASRPTTSALTW